MNTLIGTVPQATADLVGMISSIATLLCVIPLCVATYRGQAHPSPITWGLWFFVGLVATVGMATGGAPLSAWLLKLGLSLGPVAVAVVALRLGEPLSTTRVDQASLALGVLGLLGYVVIYFGIVGPADALAAGLVAVGAAMLVDAIAAGPTWWNAWRDPYRELIKTYAIALVAVVAVLLILPFPWTWLSASYLVFLAIQMVSIIAVLGLGRVRARRTEGIPA